MTTSNTDTVTDALVLELIEKTKALCAHRFDKEAYVGLIGQTLIRPQGYSELYNQLPVLWVGRANENTVYVKNLIDRTTRHFTLQNESQLHEFYEGIVKYANVIADISKEIDDEVVAEEDDDVLTHERSFSYFVISNLT